MPTSSSNVLGRSACTRRSLRRILTACFAAACEGAYGIDWKLNGLTCSEPLNEAASVSLVNVAALAGVSGKAELPGLNTVLGVPLCERESFGASVPYRSEGKVAVMGDRAFGLKPNFEGDSISSNPRPTV
jgi:hypothetical protein